MRVGVLDLETATGEGVGEIDDGSLEVAGAERIDQDADAKELGDQIIGTLLVELHLVLKTRATAALDIDPEALVSRVRFSRAAVAGAQRGEKGAAIIGSASTPCQAPSPKRMA